MYNLSILPPKQHKIPLIVSRQISNPNVSPMPIYILAECGHVRVDLDRRNAFIQSFHISTCKQHIVFILMQHVD